MKWTRTRLGYLSADRHWFLERGAPMTCGGTAWLVWHQVMDRGDIAYTPGVGTPWYRSNGNPLRTLTELTLGEATTAPNTGSGYYLHVGDAGSLAEAKVWAVPGGRPVESTMGAS